MDRVYSAQLDHMILFFITIQTTSENYFFSDKKLGIGTSFAQVKIDQARNFL